MTRSPRGLPSGRTRVRFAALLPALLLAACATAPDRAIRPIESRLLPGYPAYFSADVAGNRALLAYVLGALEVDQDRLLGRTDRITGGLRFDIGGPPTAFAIASGSFPRSGAQMGLTLDRSVARQTATIDGARRVYFVERTDSGGRDAGGDAGAAGGDRGDANALQIALPESGIVYIAIGSTRGVAARAPLIETMLADRSPAELSIAPDVFERLTAVGSPGRPLATIVLTDPGAGFLSALGVDAPFLPITTVALSVAGAPGADRGVAVAGTGPLLLSGDLVFRNERDAALFARVGRVFVVLLVRALGLDAASAQAQTRIAVSGTSVEFSGIPMTPEELVAVIRSLARPGRPTDGGAR
ncbi:MAG: hypothetical protein EA382_18885 [Spirochaetaceae bacterium]|nr:MAG: hypothetical protein EA382_18885 [Spirochaetaceae bacterium]